MEPVNKIDALFKQKLGQQEAKPSTEAWEKLQQQLNHKKKSRKPLMWSIAAAVTLLLVGVWVFQSVPTTDTTPRLAAVQLSMQDHVALNTDKTVTKPAVSEKQNVLDAPAQQAPVSNSAKMNTAVQVQVLVQQQPVIERETIALASLDAPYSPKMLEEKKWDIPSAEGLMENQSIEIIYKPNNKEMMAEANKKKNSLIAKASELSWSDIRSAKNQIFASALSFNKNNNSQNSK